MQKAKDALFKGNNNPCIRVAKYGDLWYCQCPQYLLQNSFITMVGKPTW
jgi:hypothetical protein|tara:strand:- start:125 stop:271 length:147 start_codon:yes stop_codon:yes gene_type:complete